MSKTSFQKSKQKGGFWTMTVGQREECLKKFESSLRIVGLRPTHFLEEVNTNSVYRREIAAHIKDILNPTLVVRKTTQRRRLRQYPLFETRPGHMPDSRHRNELNRWLKSEDYHGNFVQSIHVRCPGECWYEDEIREYYDNMDSRFPHPGELALLNSYDELALSTPLAVGEGPLFQHQQGPRSNFIRHVLIIVAYNEKQGKLELRWLPRPDGEPYPKTLRYALVPK